MSAATWSPQEVETVACGGAGVIGAVAGSVLCGLGMDSRYAPVIIASGLVGVVCGLLFCLAIGLFSSFEKATPS